ncbi:MAG: ECF RNA polymerase sigma factor SigE [Candidatus Ordinivivax streblomastigis]|uniref:ECF RNA polymerase sigma factor SigE n=1 Tax=Candidatus Ordinivivax streblomastigis TaxID=2540710 RepID=A0A5M8P163_9BACT|nr:MAG: ECF RNA polymerase sigma factor SigE [Candidatus Ordinivivax streblomastigis]
MKQDKFNKKIWPMADKLFRLALSITGNRQDAEDVLQDTLFKVWKKHEEWKAIDNLEAYCYRSARNIALDKLALKENQQEAWDEDYDLPEIKSNAQEQLEEEEQRLRLEEAIRRLPEKQRTVFQLREVEELTYKQIAESLNISEEQVKINLFRARQKLRTFLEE